MCTSWLEGRAGFEKWGARRMKEEGNGARGDARRKSVNIRLREKQWKRTHQVASEESKGDGMRHAVQGQG